MVVGRRELVRWLGWRKDLGEDLISAQPPPWLARASIRPDLAAFQCLVRVREVTLSSFLPFVLSCWPHLPRVEKASSIGGDIQKEQQAARCGAETKGF